jgi:hypothetical protein
MLKTLGINSESTPEQIRAAYGEYEIKFADWMTISLAEDKLIVMTYQGQHAQIEGLHHLLRSGFTITRDKKPEN